jgi:uncharacterized metal-binding protein YceD (DUF177 family)
MSPPVPKFSHIVNLQDLPPNGADYEISANAAECAGLAERFGLVRIDGLDAKLHLQRRARGAMRLNGKVSAKVTQTCVATLETVEESVETEFDIVFRPDFEDLPSDELEFDNELDVEPLTGEFLDIADIVAEEMALSINPYPRAATAPAIGPDGGDAGAGSARERPFAVLGTLKSKDTNI